MGKRDKRKPKALREPARLHEPRVQHDPGGSDNETVVWIISTFDIDGPWGLNAIRQIDWRAFLEQLKGFESMTSAEICRGAGGRAQGNNCHPIDVGALTKNAQRRLAEIRLDDVDQVFSFRLMQTLRLYGIRDRRVCRLLWIDPWHGDNSRAVVPTRER